uniref:Uncharacterized protein n=1 Tax=Anabas testudineus TaxID=64144 RepID=A0A3Q1IZ56_ANATE
IPGTLPTRLTTILSLLFPVRTFTALLMVMLSRLMPFTSTSLSPTSRPASSPALLLLTVHGRVDEDDPAHGRAGSGSTPALLLLP